MALALAKKLVLLVFCTWPLLVNAELYAGVNLGSNAYSFENQPTNALEVQAGTFLNRHLALEASYVDFGEAEKPPQEPVFNVSGIGLGAKALLPLGQTLGLYAKMGVLAWQSEWQYEDRTQPVGEGSDLAYGGGLAWQIGRDFDFNLEYKTVEFSDMGRAYSSNLSAGFSFAF